MRGSVVVILNTKNEVLILRRAPGDYWCAGKWGYPGGKLEPGETAKQAATRETKEETDLDVTGLVPIALELDISLGMYYTRSYSGVIKLDFEHTAWLWVSRSEIENYDLSDDTLEIYDWVLQND
jgi:mutator protein MutT|tara:strand:+ start:1711 stop:2082 length:372 start_codon:yes stop_codon:yes gene_type:complete